jgi:hypothetical protein
VVNISVAPSAFFGQEGLENKVYGRKFSENSGKMNFYRHIEFGLFQNHPMNAMTYKEHTTSPQKTSSAQTLPKTRPLFWLPFS